MPNMRKTPKSSIKTQLFGQETDDLVTFANVVGRMLCIHPRLSVCLFVCLLAGLLKKLWTDLNEIL